MTGKAAEKNLRYRAAGLAAFVLLAALGFTLPRHTSNASGLASPEPQRRVVTATRPVAQRAANRRPRTDYRKFNHASSKHREQACDACHKFPSPNWKEARPTGDAAFPDVVQQPQHASCLNCHREQFFARERPAPAICSVCHTESTPRRQPRHPFPNPLETFNQTARARDFISDFRIFFPHDKHVEIVSALRPAHEREAGASFVNVSFARNGNRAQQKETPKQGEKPQEAKPNETSCAVCHQTYAPQGETEEEYATKPPPDLGEAFWLKKGAFKTTPNHASCFNCHSQETGVLPAPNNCAACHRLAPAPPTRPRTDFDPKVAAAMNVSDPVILRKWRRRTSGTFRHEWIMHADLSCNACHNVTAMNTLDEATKKVPILSCGGAGAGCHVTPTTAADAGALNLALEERKAKPGFQCTKCHLTLGREPVPKSHLEAVEMIKQTGGS
ncbi:MAG: Class cytochrome family [Pyrinomonadaceae bacterium]|nr:Class cytochrome family [Pyrinomonadaceae bacterium]